MSGLKVAGFFVVRTPHLPFDVLRSWGEGLVATAATGDDDATLSAAVERDREVLGQRLREIVTRPAVREAIFVASPSLDERISKWLKVPQSKDGRKVENVLVRYVERMASRATPFGLFAAVTVGRVGERTQLRLTEDKRRVRIDMEYLVRIGERLERSSEFRAVLRFRPNRALYDVGAHARLPVLEETGRTRAFRLVAIRRDAAFETALRAAGTGGARRDEIAAQLVSDEVTLEDARAYVDELIDSQVLQAELVPPVTGDDPMGAVIEDLDSLVTEGAGGAIANARDVLATARTELAQFEEEPLGCAQDRYRQIAAVLQPFGVGSNPAHVLQVDMTRSGEALLAKKDVEAIARGVEVLRAMAPSDRPLESFVRSFVARYEQREVPLMEALDEEFGVAFAAPVLRAPLLAGLPLDGRHNADSYSWDERTRLLARRLERAWSDHADVVELEPADWAPLAKPPLPASLAAFVSVLGSSRGREDERRFLLHAFTGASAARLIGRFSVWSAELTRGLRAHLREEERTRPEAVFAEVVHMPTGPRMGNILLRAVLRDHEIAFCGRPGVPEDRVIPLSDLLLSVRNGVFVLRSARLNREVVPRMSSAHYFQANNLGVYRFLATLQDQSAVTRGFWDWGPFATAASLPRVQVGNVILARREWALDERVLKELVAEEAAARFRAFARLRASRRLPRFVGVKEGQDSVLPIDLENIVSIDAAVGSLKRRTTARLMELFCQPEDLVAEGPQGHHLNEVVVPFIHLPAEAQPPSPVVFQGSPRIRRQFGPGSEWLFAKIYCAPGAVDDVLRDCVRPVASSLPRGIQPWFFIRYTDPDSHLRVRFHGPPDELLHSVLPALRDALSTPMRTGLVSRFETATYEREVERYGGDEGMELCERVFHFDSEAALAVVEALASDQTEERRWRWALAGVDRMLADFGFDLAARHRFADGQRRKFLAESGAGPPGEHAMAARYRKERPALEGLLAQGNPTLTRILDARSAATAPVVAELVARRDRLSAPLEDVVASLAHMWNNRVLLTKARRHELVIHEFLARLYESRLARARKGASAAASSRSSTGG